MAYYLIMIGLRVPVVVEPVPASLVEVTCITTVRVRGETEDLKIFML